MQIFELTQPRKRTIKEYDPNRPPPKKNYGTNVGPGVQPQYTATPRMKTAPQPGPAPRLPAPSANAVATTNTPPELQVIDAPKQLTGPTATKQIGTNYDPNVIDVEAKPKTNTPVLPAPSSAPTASAVSTAPATAALGSTPTPRQASQAIQSYQDTAAATEPPAEPAAQPEVAPAPSTPGVKGSRMGAIVGALGNRLAAHNAARVGLSVPDTGTANPYGDQRAAAAKVSAPLISQQAREEMAKWNRALTNAVKQAGVSGPAQLPQASRNALELSLMNQVYTNFLQNRLGKDYRQLTRFVEPEAQQEAAAQIAKLDNAISAIMNFNAPKSNPEAELQRWQDLSQSTYDMRSLLQHYQQANQAMPDITNTPDGSYYIGNYKLNTTNAADSRLASIIQGQIKNGHLPDIFVNPSDTYQIGDFEFEAADTPAAIRLKQIIKSQRSGGRPSAAATQQRSTAQQPPAATGSPEVTQALTGMGYTPQQAAALAAKVPQGTSTADAVKQILQGRISESLSWSQNFDPSRTLLKKIRQP